VIKAATRSEIGTLARKAARVSSVAGLSSELTKPSAKSGSKTRSWSIARDLELKLDKRIKLTLREGKKLVSSKDSQIELISIDSLPYLNVNGVFLRPSISNPLQSGGGARGR